MKWFDPHFLLFGAVTAALVAAYMLGFRAGVFQERFNPTPADRHALP